MYLSIKGTFKKSEMVIDDYVFFFLSDFLYKSVCCGYSFELHQQVDAIQTSTHNICLVDAIQMSTHNICLYKKVDKK